METLKVRTIRAFSWGFVQELSRRILQFGISILLARILVPEAFVHTRRTRLLFHKALANDINVGIIAVPNPDYDSRHWWRYSQGVKDVVSETVAFIYAKLLFYPSDSKHDLRP